VGSILFDSSRDHNLALAHLAKAVRRAVEIKLTLQRSSEPWALTSFPTPRESTTRHPPANCCFTLWVPFAQFELGLIAERVRAGIAHARALERIGRPRAEINMEQVRESRHQGRSLREIAKALAVPFREVRLALAGGTGPDNISATSGN
jgi:hypothetical protein